MKPFEPIGDQAQWLTIYARISEMKIGDEITDAEVAALLPDAAPSSRPGAFRRAVKECEDEIHRTFERRRGRGRYVMVHPREQERLANTYRKRASSRMKAAVRKVSTADRSLLSPLERRRFDDMEDHLRILQSTVTRMAARQRRTEDELRTIRRTHSEDLAQVAGAVAEEARHVAREATMDLLRRHGVVDAI